MYRIEICQKGMSAVGFLSPSPLFSVYLSPFLAVIVVLFLLKTTIFTFSDEPRDAGPFFSLLQEEHQRKKKP